MLAPVVRSAVGLAAVLLSPNTMLAVPKFPLAVLIVPLLMTMLGTLLVVGDNERVPVPVLTRLPVGPVIVPRNPAGLVLSPPTVKVAEPSKSVPPRLPPPLSEPIELLKLLRSRVTPLELLSVTAALLPNAVVLPARRVPLVTLTGAVNVLLPESTIMPLGLLPRTAEVLSRP